ncbi:MAG: hypothetical protein Q8P70_00430 [bacterium]|nr:hypothetical protein [bacterium]
MNKKKTIKKIKSSAKDIKSKTISFVKKATKKTNNAVSILKTQWEKEQPHREKFKIYAQKALENSTKIGNDVFKTIKKDINEIKKQKKSKK